MCFSPWFVFSVLLNNATVAPPPPFYSIFTQEDAVGFDEPGGRGLLNKPLP